MTDYAQLAQSLKDNEAFQLALTNQRNDALENLATVLPTEIDRIRSYQATVRVIDGIRDNLDTFIRAGAVKAKPGIA